MNPMRNIAGISIHVETDIDAIFYALAQARCRSRPAKGRGYIGARYSSLVTAKLVGVRRYLEFKQ